MKLKELVADIDGLEIINEADVDVKRINIDSRQVEAGSLFVAINGFTKNGEDYITDALKKGAILFLLIVIPI